MTDHPTACSTHDVWVSPTAPKHSLEVADRRREVRTGQSSLEISVSPTVPAHAGDVPVDLSIDDNDQADQFNSNIDHTAGGSDGKESFNTTSDDGFGEETLEENFDMENVYENGRRYANDSCLYPNDDTEETRLNISHQVRRLLLNGDCTTGRVSSNVRRILDVGTGPGDWAIAMGEAYPHAQIIATDITVYSPVAAPPNVDFRIEDATQEWYYDEPFDFIHMRDMVAALPDFSHMYRQAAKNLKQNGTFELVTCGPILLKHNYATSALKEWTELLSIAREANGDKTALDYKGKAAIEGAGLREMKRLHKEVPLGEWMPDISQRRVGRMALVACLEGIEAASLRALTRYLEWTADQARDLIERVKSELLDPRNEPYCELEWVVAKRLMI